MPQSLVTRQGPSPSVWDSKKALITRLWSENTLREVIQIMEREHDFKASIRMYTKRLQKWGLYKNLKSSVKRQLCQVHNISLSTPPSTVLDMKDWRKLRRYFKAQSASGTTRDNPTAAVPLTSRRLASQVARSRSIQPSKCNQQMLAQRTAQSLWTPASQLQSANLDFILYNISTFYTIGNFDASPQTLQTEFWRETGFGIYLLKVSDRKRGFRLLQKSCLASSSLFAQGSTTILIEILSTVSPVNTTVCPPIRQSILRFLSALASEQLPPGHPIALVTRKLREDNDCREVSERALSFVAERLRDTLGPVHDLTLLAQRRLIALLRRSRNFGEAIWVCKKAIEAIRADLGAHSLQARLAARYLEHIYLNEGEWRPALDVCFEIVGHRDVFGVSPNPLYHDECAVWTMEDIAKIYESVGDPTRSVAWLKQASISGGLVWGTTTQLAHIIDKLEALLRRCGRADEAHVWSTSLGPFDE